MISNPSPINLALPTLPFVVAPNPTGNALQDTLNLQGALTSAAGSVLWIPAGTYEIMSPLAVPGYTTITGNGHGTVLQKATDVEIFRIVGASSGSHLHRNNIYNLILDGAWGAQPTPPFSQPLLYTNHVDTMTMINVNFQNNGGPGWMAADTQDVEVYNCRHDFCSSVGGLPSGTLPAMYFQNQAPADAGLTGSIKFFGCTWESFTDGAIWLYADDNGGTPNMPAIKFFGCKLDTTSTNLGFVRLRAVRESRFEFELSVGPVSSAFTTPADVFYIAGCRNLFFLDSTYDSNSGGTHAFRTYMNFDGTTGLGQNSGMTLRDIYFSVTATTNTPTIACVQWNNPNIGVAVNNVQYINNGGVSPVQWSGQPNDLVSYDAYSANNAVPTDAIFYAPPMDGARALDTATGIVYVRNGGIWVAQ